MGFGIVFFHNFAAKAAKTKNHHRVRYLGKVIKIMLSSISFLILAAFILPLALSLLLSIPGVQKFAVDKTTGFLSDKLETTVSVRDVRIRLFSRVALGGVYLQDLKGDTLFAAEGVAASLSNINFINGKISLGEVSLESPRFYLTHDSTGRSNLTQLFSKLKKKEKKPAKRPFMLSARSVTVSDMNFRARKYEPREREYGVNFDDVDVNGFNLRAHDIAIKGDSVTLSIDEISLREKSGFDVRALSSGTFAISGKGMYFNNLKIATPDSEMDMPYLYFRYDSWKDYKYFIDKVVLQAEATNSTVSYATIAMFAPTLRDWKMVYRNASLTVDGPVSALTGTVRHLECGKAVISGARFSINGIPDIPNTTFHFDVSRLASPGGDIAYILNDITRKQNPKASEMLRHIDRMTFSGRFDGLFSDFKANGRLTSNVGDADLNVNFKPLNDNKAGFDGRVNVRGLDLGKLLDAEKLGKLTAEADVKGSMGGGNVNFSTEAEVRQLQFNGYDYGGITIRGDFRDKLFNGYIGSADSNIHFDFDGLLDFNDSIPKYNFDLHLAQADLKKLNFNRRDSISTLSCNIVANGSGVDIDRLNGKVEIDSLVYVNHLDSVRTGAIVLTAKNDERLKQLSMRSSFADVDFRGRQSYDKMIAYFNNTLLGYLPSIYANSKGVAEQHPHNGRKGAADMDDYYIINLNVKEANRVAGIFLPGLELAQGTNLAFMFNPESDLFSLSLRADYIERGGFFVTNLNVLGRNQSDSISLFVGAEDLFVKGFYLPDFSIIGGAKDNRLRLSTSYNNHADSTGALLNTLSEFGHDPVSGIPQVKININSSAIRTGKQVWRIMARDIVYDSTKVSVRRFRIANEEQALEIDGVASSKREDTLHVRLRNFDLTPLSQITDRQGYSISGLTNGYANLSAAFGESMLVSEITVDSLKVNDIKVPSTVFDSRWDYLSKHARFTILNKESRDTVLRGMYRPSDKRYRADVELKNVQLSLLDPLLGSVMRETEGHADAKIRIVGQQGAPKLSGKIEIPAFASTVDYTNVRYTMSGGVINVENNVLSMKNTPLRDPAKGRARLDMSVDLNHLSNIVYDIRIAPENCMVLNTTLKDNNQFYGTIYASGSATIKGDKSGVKMNIVASTDDNSAFFMPLNTNKSVASTDFIQFYSAKEEAKVAEDEVAARKEAFVSKRARRKKAEGGGLDMDMTVNVRPNAEMQLVIDPTVGDIIKGSGNGTINMRVNPRNNDFTIYGDYEITEGSYLFTLRNIINKRFIINPGGTIKWTGDPVNAILDITAVYKLRASLAPLLGSGDENFNRRVPVDCEIHLGDRLLQPTITFNVVVPGVDPETQSLVNNAMNTQEMMATQFIWLLAINSFYSESPGTSQNMNIGATGGAVTGIEFLTNQLSNWLSTDKFSLVPRYRPKSDTSSDEFGFEFSAELIKNKLVLEGEGSYDSGNNLNAVNQRANNLTGDFYLTWMLDQEGHFKAKAFTRTVDRFDENQGLQESGIGIYYHEDFNTVKDIVRKFKERAAKLKRSPEKKAAREEAKKAKEAEKEKKKAEREEEKN